MHLPKMTLLLTSLAHARAAAVPLADDDGSDLVVVHTRPIGSATLGYLGEPWLLDADIDWDAGWNDTKSFNSIQTPTRASTLAPAQNPGTAVKRDGCLGTNLNQVHCSGENLGPFWICRELVNVVGGNPTVRIPAAIRGVYLAEGNDKCYIGWRHRIEGMEQGYLFPAALKTLDYCRKDGGVSGWAEEVILNKVCTSQCMSNRAVC